MNRGVANNPALADFSASCFELRLDERNQACGRSREAEGPLQHLRKRDEAGITDNKINGLRNMLPRQNPGRSEEHTSELQSLMRISYAVFCLKKKKHIKHITNTQTHNTKIQSQHP